MNKNIFIYFIVAIIVLSVIGFNFFGDNVLSSPTKITNLNKLNARTIDWIVFVTSTTFNGDLGGSGTTQGAIQNAETVCNAEAAQNGLPGTYVPWISYDTGTQVRNAKDYINEGRFVNVYGQTIANNKADLLDGDIDNAIDPTASGPFTWVWTGTLWDGTSCSYGLDLGGHPSGDCHDWTGTGPLVQGAGVVGKPAASTSQGYPFGGWTSGPGCSDFVLSCGANAHIYCFQVSH